MKLLKGPILLVFTMITICSSTGRVYSSGTYEESDILYAGVSVIFGVAKSVISGRPKVALSEYEKEVIKLCAKGSKKPEDLQPALLLLQEGGEKGEVSCLYHYGRLLVGVPDRRLTKLAPLVPIDYPLGKSLLSEASRMGIKTPPGVVQAYVRNKLYNEALESVAVDNPSEEILKKARKKIDLVIRQGNIDATFRLAEALLKSTGARFPWMKSPDEDLLSRRRRGMSLLSILTQANHPAAQELFEGVEYEDASYPVFCALIWAQRKEPITIEEVGGQQRVMTPDDDGYLKLWIQITFDGSGLKTCPATFTSDKAPFFGALVVKRIQLIRSYLSDYYQYLGYLVYKEKIHEDDQTKRLALEVKHIVNEYKLVIPAYTKKDDHHPEKVYDLLTEGLACRITTLEAETACEMMLTYSDF